MACRLGRSRATFDIAELIAEIPTNLHTAAELPNAVRSVHPRRRIPRPGPALAVPVSESMHARDRIAPRGAQLFCDSYPSPTRLQRRHPGGPRQQRARRGRAIARRLKIAGE